MKKLIFLSLLTCSSCCDKCPDPVDANEWRNKAMYWEKKWEADLDSADKAHQAHVDEILARPTLTERINDNFTTSPNADAARRKFRDVLLQRPAVHNVDTLR